MQGRLCRCTAAGSARCPSHSHVVIANNAEVLDDAGGTVTLLDAAGSEVATFRHPPTD